MLKLYLPLPNLKTKSPLKAARPTPKPLQEGLKIKSSNSSSNKVEGLMIFMILGLEGLNLK